MDPEQVLINERIGKLKELKALNVDAYPYKYSQTHHAEQIKKAFSHLKEHEKTNETVSIAGRLMTKRDMGKASFATMTDQTGAIQIYANIDNLGEQNYKLFRKLDLGDILGVKGIVFKTKTGEITVEAKEVTLLSKSLRPLPDKYHGIHDPEIKYRKRYLDLATEPKSKKIFVTRAKILEIMREFMKKNSFLEVETPILQSVYGGAAAKPFKTHCDAYDSDLFLSIAPELYLKKALVGGFERVYEITKKFRNEGADRMHNPEHMTLEWYQSYADYNDGMKLFENLMKEIAMNLFGKLEFEYQGHKINLNKWKKIPLLDAIKEYLGEDVREVKTDAEAKKIAQKHGVKDINAVTKVNLPDELMKLFREKLIQPTFLIDYPVEMCPLAKISRKDSTKAEIFQPFVGGMELARAYSELNDPKIQAEHFKEQEAERKKGNKEAMPTDTDFVVALEHGMPPACGVGIGVERFVMLFSNSSTVRDVVMFPFMKPIVAETPENKQKKA
ncbi:lysine--tRNA ligase [Candidatus Woesearchaeota archaeon]|nr:lysine--tRNA ligase [Candidatus Woesearchaeota archaeon]